MRKTLSVAIVTQDEAATLERTLSTIAWADEIVIVDSGSREYTEDLARRFYARFFDEAWKGFAAQKNSALDKCTCDWVLSLNGDETLSDGMAKEVWEILHDHSALDGYAVPRRNLFLGRWMRFGGYSRKPKLRMFLRGSAEFEPSRFHEGLERLHFVGKAGLLKGHLVRYRYPTLYAYIEHMDRYSSPGTAHAVEPGKRNLDILSFIGNVLLAPIARFLYNYLFRLGFLDGREGLLLHLYHSVSMSWKHAKAWEMNRGSGRGPS